MKNYKNALILVMTFMISHMFVRHLWGDSWSAFLRELAGGSPVVQVLARWLFIYSPFVMVGVLIFRHVKATEVLGLSLSGAIRHFKGVLLVCLPMLVGYAWLSTELNTSVNDFITGALYPGVFEEIVFRAVLFGGLFRFCGLGFIPAALISSLIFGVGHLYQSNDLMSAIMLMSFMAVAGSWFAWLYCESGYKIWFPAGMHVLMNGAYGFFSMSGGAMGDMHSNIFKGMTIILSIVYVSYQIRRSDERAVTRNKLWVNRG